MNMNGKTVGEIVVGRSTYVVEGDTFVLDVARYMTERQIGAVSVVDDKGLLSGIFSERDLMTRVVAEGLDLASTRVREVMTRKVAVLDVDSTYQEALAIMTALHVRHLPVMIDQRPLGCVSIRDLHQAEIEVKDKEIEFLDTYIDRIEQAL